ncbi:SacI domain-containing protein [Eremomyces bilateralis CBS 781.70]|uniref:SacI domain-containing protein n=1 Tax=Eremomyces bilateralis CBS 781.70 TaxID=1392243 RepID=A0A6G1FUY4_9PEZI|nr:SacI domain-containing protein [Eremomyces bilateralis CBS 781.70]KAF1809516.1 SacI domain-containing protein [Eremomyces bilateralis CBS 781.70]
MPGIVRRMLVLAAIDGLVLQPIPPRNQKPATEPAITVGYRTNVIQPLQHERREEAKLSSSFEAHGVVGLLKFASSSFLVLISARDQVAQIHGTPIFTLTDVAVIPLSSQHDAETAIAHIRATQQHTGTDEDGEDTASETETILSEESMPTPEREGLREGKGGASEVVEDVFGRRGMYGRFAERWFSRRWRVEPEVAPETRDEMELEELRKREARDEAGERGLETPLDETAAEEVNRPETPEAVTGDEDIDEPLLPKVLKVAKLLFTSRSFYFSYDYDLSRTVTEQDTEPDSVPLSRRFNSLYFWNRHITDPFMEAGQHSFVLPLLQGFVGQREFEVEVSPTSKEGAIVSASKPEGEDEGTIESAESPGDPQPSRKQYLLTLVSRRSVKRSGLRYLRRGVDEDGNTANSVETEQIFSSCDWDDHDTKIHSFVQCRGSIPLFFSQTPYSFKPIPAFFGSPETNRAAFRLHFSSLIERYGRIQAVSLVDKKATERKIGQEFEDYANEVIDSGVLGEGKLGFLWFDFHHACRGMKFENVSVLLDSISPFLESTAWSIQEGDRLIQRQSGVLRTNCMDCLDRTNVVQSACGRDVLEKQLATCNVLINLHTDPSTSWFNTLWADNGDAISAQYAGTAALKGDYTRTRKRNISGALNDFRLTLNRYYNNIVNDYLAQAVIDYLLGRASAQVFVDFEAEMMSQDYAVDLKKMRQGAIDNCLQIAVEDAREEFIAGYALTSPRRPSTLKSLPFEECVLLLTGSALYLCRFDWNTEKLREFERVELEDVIDITRGVYITSTLAPKHLDETKNIGIVIRYVSKGPRMVRTNTRSLGNKQKEGEVTPEEGEDDTVVHQPTSQETKFWALKAGQPVSTLKSIHSDATALNEREILDRICQDVKQAVDSHRQPASETEAEPGKEAWRREPLTVEEDDIISVAEAKKSTGLLEQMTYNLKRLVWT